MIHIHNINKAISIAAVVLLVAFPVAAQPVLHKVTAVPTAKMLQLEDGTIVRLAAIQAPNLAQNSSEKDEPLAQQALAALQRLALDKTVRLEPVGKGVDRRGRVVAMVYEGDAWLQEALLREGMAWVYTFDDSRAYAPALLAAEHEAEAAQRGVWAEEAYAVLPAVKAAEHMGEFRLVEGKVTEVAERRGKYYVNFGGDWKTDFTLLIEKSAVRNFDIAWLNTLAGKTVRARGWLFSMHGPAIELTHPEQLEVE